MSKLPEKYTPGETIIVNLGFKVFALARINEICGSEFNITLESIFDKDNPFEDQRIIATYSSAQEAIADDRKPEFTTESVDATRVVHFMSIQDRKSV